MRTAVFAAVAVLLLVVSAQLAVAQAPEVTHNTWTSGAAMPTPVWIPAGAGVLSGKIYVVGGVNGESDTVADTQIYNLAENTWSTGTPLPAATYGGAGAVVKGVLYIIGGSSNGTSCGDAVWAYNPTKKTWAAMASMPTARCSIGAAVEDNIIYVIGGNGNEGDLRLTTVESYNPATNTWTEEAPLLVGKSEPTVALVGTTIVAADGFTFSGDTGDTEGYDAATNVWTSLAADPTHRNTAFGGGIGPNLYVAGGYPGDAPGTPAITLNEAFNPKTNKWKTLAPMPQAAMFGASAVYKGQLYCIGGTSEFSESGTVLGNVQIYQP